jgi:hypothetical protein
MSSGQERLIQAIIRGVVMAILAAIASFTPFLLSKDFADALQAAGVNAVFVPSVVGIATGALSLIAKFLGGVTIKPVLPPDGEAPRGAARDRRVAEERPNALAI